MLDLTSIKYLKQRLICKFLHLRHKVPIIIIIIIIVTISYE